MQPPDEMHPYDEHLPVELRRLNRGDTLRAMPVLVAELAAEEEAWLIYGTHYDIWSPFHAGSAAETLLHMLAVQKEISHV